MGGVFSSSPSESEEMKNCKLNCQTNYGTPREVTGAQVPVLITGKGGGKRRKSTLFTFKKGFSEASRRQPSARAKRKATMKRRH
jgi:hypothetical protein